jgi:hypothetical protein
MSNINLASFRPRRQVSDAIHVLIRFKDEKEYAILNESKVVYIDPNTAQKLKAEIKYVCPRTKTAYMGIVAGRASLEDCQAQAEALEFTITTTDDDYEADVLSEVEEEEPLFAARNATGSAILISTKPKAAATKSIAPAIQPKVTQPNLTPAKTVAKAINQVITNSSRSAAASSSSSDSNESDSAARSSNSLDVASNEQTSTLSIQEQFDMLRMELEGVKKSNKKLKEPVVRIKLSL